MFGLKKEIVRFYVIRFLKIMAVTSILIFIMNEASFYFLGNIINRGPETIELVIPAGTAELVAAGEDVPSIPDEMIFVIGDVLVVRNEDQATHELGPVVVLPGSTASLPMDVAGNLAMACSFTSSNYLGVDVREATDWITRIVALLSAAPPTAVIAFLYSLALSPVGEYPKETASK